MANVYLKSQIPEHLLEFFEPAEIGLEATPDEFVAKLVAVFREVRRVLRDDGTAWLNLGDSYASGKPRTDADCEAGELRWANRQSELRAPGLKQKDLIGIPWMVAFALRADGWYLRQDIIWAKPNPMPESVTDRCTKSHEYMFLLSKSATYFCDMAAIKEDATCDRMRGPALHRDTVSTNGNGGLARREIAEDRNKRTVWNVATQSYRGAHFATFPTKLIEPCILAGAPTGGVVLDPFFGSGTTGQVAQALGRKYIGIELNKTYKPLQDARLSQPSLDLEAA